MKIAFFTPRSITPLHPRLVSFQAYFKNRNISVDFINASGYESNLKSRINWIVLWFFDLYAISRCKDRVKDYDIIFINDLKYLPLAKHAKKLNKIVIYDTIDHNVHLRFYQLQQKIPIIKIFKNLIISRFSKIEKKYADQFCDEVFVNSDSLNNYFDEKANTLYYSSPLEKIESVNNPDNPPALLYLGGFSFEKGATEILSKQKKLNIPLFIFGPVGDDGLDKELKNTNNVFYTPKLSVDDLEKNLITLLGKYFLFGFSLIRAAHYSYEVQEANKDIDYLSLGIPLLGNYRLTTKNIIDAGCGIFYDDKNLRSKIVDYDIRRQLNINCKKHYAKRYASDLFKQKLDSVLNKYL